MAEPLVKLDNQGRVVGVAPGRARDGWISVAYHPAVVRDPFSHRLCPENGWVRMTDEEKRDRDLAQLQRQGVSGDPEPRRLLAKLEAGTIEAGERDRLLLLLAHRVLGEE